MQGLQLLAQEQDSLAAGSITASYVKVGEIDNPSAIVYIFNQTDGDLQFSLDGSTDQFVIGARGFLLLDVTANKGYPNQLALAKGTEVYVKRIDTPSTGSVYLSSFYNSTRT